MWDEITSDPFPNSNGAPGTGEFSAQMASKAENASIWWRHHDLPFPIRVLAPNSVPDTVDAEVTRIHVCGL